MGVAVQAASLVPLGQAVGIQMTTAGVLVADLAEVDTPGGTCTPAKDAGLRPGDVICRMDGRVRSRPPSCPTARGSSGSGCATA